MIGSKDFGIDLGTAGLRVCIPGRGILREPSVVAFSRTDETVAAIGQRALTVIENDPERFAKYFMKENGEIHDYATVKEALSFLIRRYQALSFFLHPDLLMGLPHGISAIERKAIRDLCVQAGFNEKGLYFIDELLASAIGAGLPVLEPTGSMVINIGAGSTQAAVFSLGGIIGSGYIRKGGQEMDRLIQEWIQKEYGILIGEATAERVKIQIGTVLPGSYGMNLDQMAVTGRSLRTGLPAEVSLHIEEILEAIQPVTQIVSCVYQVLESMPPDVSSDLLEHGITLTGGAAQMKGMDALLKEKMKIAIHVAPNAPDAVILGIQKVMRRPEEWSSIFSGLLK